MAAAITLRLQQTPPTDIRCQISATLQLPRRDHLFRLGLARWFGFRSEPAFSTRRPAGPSPDSPHPTDSCRVGGMPPAPNAAGDEQQLKACLARFPAPLARLAGTLRSRLRTRLPGLFELVYSYENQGSLVISYSPTDRGIDGVCAIAVHPGELRLCLGRGAELTKRSSQAAQGQRQDSPPCHADEDLRVRAPGGTSPARGCNPACQAAAGVRAKGSSPRENGVPHTARPPPQGMKIARGALGREGRLGSSRSSQAPA